MPEGKRMRQPPKLSDFNQSSLTIPLAWMSHALIITNHTNFPWLGIFEQSHLSTFRKTYENAQGNRGNLHWKVSV